MFSFPSSRKLLIPVTSLLVAVLMYRLILSSASSSSRILLARKLLSQVPRGTPIQDEDYARYVLPIHNPAEAHLSPPQYFYYSHNLTSRSPPDITHLVPLFACNIQPNTHTMHIRLPNLVANVSSTTPNTQADGIQRFNPTIMALPHWSPNHYLLVSRVVTEGLHQESSLCEAHIFPHHGSGGGPLLRCTAPPQRVDVPPTPAERCTGAWTALPDIPGFHDPRVFWDGGGAPLVVVNSASRYGCVGLWVVDLRTLYAPLERLLREDGRMQTAPLVRYPRLTELMRREGRHEVEKNWMLFFPGPEESFVHYDMVGHARGGKSGGGGRAFAKLIGNGYVTPNLADPLETSCFDDTVDGRGKTGHWHQASNSLRLVLCTRAEAKRGKCREDQDGRSVHFAVMHRKFSNDWDLPLRYERWFVLWEGKAPFRLLAKSRFPVLFKNETASGWSGKENWDEDAGLVEHDDDDDGRRTRRRWQDGTTHAINTTQWFNVSGDIFSAEKTNTSYTVNLTESPTQHQDEAKENWAYFTYTPSIAWAWRPKSSEIRREDRDGGAEDGSYLHGLNVGYLDDEVIVGIGLEDSAQAFAKAEARTLLQCLEVCPGARMQDFDESNREDVVKD